VKVIPLFLLVCSVMCMYSSQLAATTLPDAGSTVGVEVFDGPTGKLILDSVGGTTAASDSVAGNDTSAAGSAASLPSPHMSGFVSGGVIPGVEGAQATLSLGYFLEVAAPNNSQGPVPLPITGSGLLKGTGNGFMEVVMRQLDSNLRAIGPSQLLASACVEPAAFNCSALGPSPSFNLATTLSLITNTVYEIDLGLTISAGAEENESGTLDPVFMFDKTLFAVNGFQLELSPGVGNVPLATPLPAGLPLFVSGLGLAGLFGQRKK
jgi:hypothetical protein